MIQAEDLAGMGFELTWFNDAYGIWRRTGGVRH
ncbi:hypothetical protein J3R73_002338 [Labrys monachus]|uniref:Uncharacterized protein n=1 Tax=Labrys monachus TaxID=217067 RepID=A0ABU0FD62_9HYPH|nr:hypothetical protein [Labrys monachus]